MTKARFLNKSDLNPGGYCLISYENFKEEDYSNNKIVKLKCGHTFLYEHITESYKITNCSGRNYIGKRICPYCRKSGGYLPYNGSQAIRGVHNLNAVKVWRLKLIGEKKKTSGYNTCCATLVCGIHRGYPCGSLVKNPKAPHIYNLKINSNVNEPVFTKLDWCGKHKKSKKNFITDSINIKNYSIEYIENKLAKKSSNIKIHEIIHNNEEFGLYVSDEYYKDFIKKTEENFFEYIEKVKNNFINTIQNINVTVNA